jgi:hypothetical protein
MAALAARRAVRNQYLWPGLPGNRGSGGSRLPSLRERPYYQPADSAKAHELHSSLGGGDERYLDPVPWTQQLADSTRFIRSLAPVLRQHGSRIDLETHGDTTTWELVRLAEDVGPGPKSLSMTAK